MPHQCPTNDEGKDTERPLSSPSSLVGHWWGIRHSPQSVSHSSLSKSIAACRKITAEANSSFPVAFRLLPPHKRRAMNALYAFMRVTDDIADEPAEPSAKRRALAGWRAELLPALSGEFTHPVHPALADTVRRYQIPAQFLLDVIDGVETDLEPVRFATFADLYPYCYRVASAVGLACVRVWGLRPGATFADADKPAEAAGVALQLTNILRDLGEDLAGGRVYLPANELRQFDCPPEAWRDPRRAAAFRELLRFQVDRARDFYRQAEPLAGLLSADGRGIFRVMTGTYRRLLEEVARSGREVLTRRVRVPGWRKGLILLGGWAAKWGWV
jgi:phytoene synthase